MKSISLLVLGIVFVSFALCGCVSLSKYTPSQEATSASREEEAPVFKTNIGKQQPEQLKLEVELLEKPDFSKFSAPKTPDSELNGNQGNLEGGMLMLRKNFKTTPSEAEQKPEKRGKVWWSTMPEESAQEQPSESAQGAQTKIIEYKVKKGQTLADIAGLKEIYGDSKKWRKIYNANKNKIKDPNKIYAGQTLKIPVDVEPSSVEQKQHLK